MLCKRSGKVSNSTFGVSLIFGEDFVHNVSSFESNGELSAGASVIRAGEEWRKGLQHGTSRKTESSLTSGAVLAEILHEFGGAANCFPVNSSFVCDDRAGRNVWERREGSFEEVHRGRVISVAQHPRSNVQQKVLPCGEFIQLRKEGQRLFLRQAGDEFRQWLRRQTHSLYFVAGGFKFGLYSLQHSEGISNLLLARCSLQPHKYGDCPYLRIGRTSRSGTGLSRRLH